MTMTTLGTTPERLRGRWLGLAALTISGLVLGLDITILVTALPTLSAKLNATTDQLQWLSAAYTLALAGFMLPAGVLGDRLGRKRMLLIGLATFGISSVIASQMTSANGMILMRVVMGFSGAIVLPLMQSMLPSMFDEDERQRAIGISGAGAFIGLPLGPLLAGWLLTHYDWGCIFLINAPVVVIGVIGVWFFVPESKDPKAKKLDWIGAILEVLGVTGIVYGIIEQPLRGWTDVQVFGPIAAGAVLVAAFVVWQLRARFPLIDLKLFKSARFSWATVAFTIVGFAMTGVLFILSPFLQIVQANDAQGTGIRLLPLIATMMVGPFSTDSFANRLGAVPAKVQSAAQSSVAVAAAIARHLPSPLGAQLLRAAQDAYSQGMSEVMLVSAAMMVGGAILMALFLPARAPRESHAETLEMQVAS